MALPTHDCSRLVEVASFREKETAGNKASWFLNRYFRTRRTRAEKLELRRYMKKDVPPLFYTGACEKPHLLKGRARSLNVIDINFPIIKAETQVDGCDVDEHRIDERGKLLMPGRERYDAAANWKMSEMLDGLQATHVSEALNVLKYGGYTIRAGKLPEDVIGVVDYKRETAKWDFIDSDGIYGPWSDKCSKPSKQFELVFQHMARCGAGGGSFDIIYSQHSWNWMEAHDCREAIKFDRAPVFGSDLERSLVMGHDDVTYKGDSNGGQISHFVSNAMYWECDENGLWEMVPVLAPGEVMIINRNAFDGQRIFRTVTSDNMEALPDGADYFLYDDPMEVYNKKCRAFCPWIEEYHLMVPGNVDGATILSVVDPELEPCVECEDCPPKEGEKATLAQREAALAEREAALAAREAAAATTKEAA